MLINEIDLKKGEYNHFEKNGTKKKYIKYSIKWKTNRIIAGKKMSSDPMAHRLPHSTKPGII